MLSEAEVGELAPLAGLWPGDLVLPHILAKPRGYWLYLEPSRNPFPTSLDWSPCLPPWLLSII